MSSRTRRSIWMSVLLVGAALFGPAAVAGQDEDAPATALRVALDRLLAEHALLSMEVVRGAIAETPDLDAATAALEDNTSDIVAAIEGVYGPEAGAAFAEQWRNHIGYLFDYARARAQGHGDAAELAADQLDRYVAEFSTLVADAMPVLPDETVTQLIDEHVDQLEHVAAFDEGNFGHAYPAIRDTYRHMFDIGDGLVIGIITAFPDRFPGRDQAFSPATDLRISLDRLLGEHTHLAALAMRATINDAPDASSAADSLAENSAELRSLIADVYGRAAGDAFDALWSSHVSWYFAYVTALAEADEDGIAAALEGLNDYREDFSAFVASANPFLPEAALRSLIQAHTDHLVDQAQAYAAGNYGASHRLAREAYEHAGHLSASLAAAIGDQFPQRFPDAAMRDPGPPWPVSLTLGVVLGAIAMGLAARRRRIAPIGRSVSA